MATYVLGAIILVALFFAARHVFRNFSEGKHDCCGCDACGTKPKEETPAKEEGSCPYCASHNKAS